MVMKGSFMIMKLIRGPTLIQQQYCYQKLKTLKGDNNYKKA